SPDGHAEFIMERAMKASHRTLGTPPYDNLGLPWSISSKEAIAATPPLNEGLAELKFALPPTANVFDKGNRMRIVITGADADNNLTMPYFPAPVQSVQLGGDKASFISAPVLKTDE
ncbi:MAG: CocE/NonD family hydrolase C-terminal non-catalytic domain-containing protein, partial [Pseudomonadota bacterium]